MPKTVKRRKNKLAGRYRNRWPDEAEISGRMIPKWVADSCRNRWPDHPEICNGELDHGEKGLIDDYSEMFRVNSKASVLLVLKALGLRKRSANKLLCPCGCGHHLGLCSYRFFLNEFRCVERRRWFRSHLAGSFTPIQKKIKGGINYAL